MEKNFLLINTLRQLKDSFLTLPPPTPNKPLTFHFLRSIQSGRKTKFTN